MVIELMITRNPAHALHVNGVPLLNLVDMKTNELTK